MKLRMISTFLFFNVLNFHSLQADDLSSAALKNKAWCLEIAALHHNHELNSEHSIKGLGSRLSIGYGFIEDRYFFLGEFSFLLGPHASQFKTVDFDHNGTGINLSTGFSINGLRKVGPGIGFLTSLSYSDMKGKSYARNDFGATPATPEGIVTKHTKQSAMAEVSGGIFISWFESKRLDDVQTKNLLTRNEGLLISLQGAIPIWSSMHVKHSVLDANKNEEELKDKGPINGFKVILSVRTFLGT